MSHRIRVRRRRQRQKLAQLLAIGKRAHAAIFAGILRVEASERRPYPWEHVPRPPLGPPLELAR